MYVSDKTKKNIQMNINKCSTYFYNLLSNLKH